MWVTEITYIDANPLYYTSAPVAPFGAARRYITIVALPNVSSRCASAPYGAPVYII